MSTIVDKTRVEYSDSDAMRFIQDSKVLITGATSGIGRRLSVELAGRGARLCLTGRNAGALDETAALCRSHGARVVTIPADLTDPESCNRVVDHAATELGGIDLMICCAGVSMWSSLEDTEDLSIFEYLMRVNYLSVVYLCRRALPLLRRNRGMIVGLSSLAGRTGIPLRTGYSAAKFALTGFLEALRIEVEPDVKVLIVYPGMVGTGSRSKALGADGNPLGRSPRDETRATMSVEKCVALIVKAIVRQRRDLVMTGQAKIGLWLKMIAPRIVDRMAKRSVRETANESSGDTPDH